MNSLHAPTECGTLPAVTLSRLRTSQDCQSCSIYPVIGDSSQTGRTGVRSRPQPLFALVGVALQDVDEASLRSRVTGDNQEPEA
jgi:hypothetical protein